MGNPLAYRILRSSEKYFKTDMVYLAKGGFWLVSGQVAISVSSLGLSVAFANLLSPEIYGTYRYILTISNFLAIPTLTGLNAALARSAAQKMDGSLRAAFNTRLRWGLFSTLLGLGVAGYYLWQHDLVLAMNIFLIALFAPLFYSCEVYSYFLRGKKLFKDFSLYSSIAIIIPTSTVIGTLFLTKNLTLILLSYFIPYTILKGFFLFLTTRRIPSASPVDAGLISYGKHLSVMSIFGVVAQNIDKFLLWHYLGATQLAVYTFAMSPVSNMEAVMGKLDALVFPKIAERDIGEIRKTIYGKTFRIFLVVASVVTLYILCAPFLYSIAFPQYLESVAYSQVLALTLLISLPIMLVSNVFIAHARIREKYYLSLIGPGIKILLFIVLIPSYGIWGLIFGTLGFHLVSATASILFFRKIA